MATAVQKVDAPTISALTLKVEPLTCSIGAEVGNVNLGVASRDPALMQAIRFPLLTHKVLSTSGTSVAPSSPRFKAISARVKIYKSPDIPGDRYKNAWRPDATWRKKLPLICHRKMLRAGITGDTAY